MGSEHNGLDEGTTTCRTTLHLMTNQLSGSKSLRDSQAEAVDSLTETRHLTPLTLDTVLTVDTLKRLMKIVSFS